MNLIRSIQSQPVFVKALLVAVIIVAVLLGLDFTASYRRPPSSPHSYVAVNISEHDEAVLKIGELGPEGNDWKEGKSGNAFPRVRLLNLFSEDGEHIWTRDIEQDRSGKSIGATSMITGEGTWTEEMLQFKDGGILVTGTLRKSLFVNGTPIAHQPPHFSLLGDNNARSVFLLKFDGQEQLVWSKSIGPLLFGSEGNFMTAITDADTILLVSTFKGSVETADSEGNKVVLRSTKELGLLAAEFDPSSGLLWIEQIGGGWIWLRTLEAFPDDEYIVGGSFAHGTWFDRKNGEVMSFPDDSGSFFALASFGGNS